MQVNTAHGSDRVWTVQEVSVDRSPGKVASLTWKAERVAGSRIALMWRDI